MFKFIWIKTPIHQKVKELWVNCHETALKTPITPWSVCICIRTLSDKTVHISLLNASTDSYTLAGLQSNTNIQIDAHTHKKFINTNAFVSGSVTGQRGAHLIWGHSCRPVKTCGPASANTTTPVWDHRELHQTLWDVQWYLHSQSGQIADPQTERRQRLQMIVILHRRLRDTQTLSIPETQHKRSSHTDKTVYLMFYYHSELPNPTVHTSN